MPAQSCCRAAQGLHIHKWGAKMPTEVCFHPFLMAWYDAAVVAAAWWHSVPQYSARPIPSPSCTPWFPACQQPPGAGGCQAMSRRSRDCREAGRWGEEVLALPLLLQGLALLAWERLST